MRILSVLCLVPITWGAPAYLIAQGPGEPFPCLTNDVRILGADLTGEAATMARIAADDDALEQFTQAWGEFRGGGPYIIPVVFHIIHQNGAENISDEQVEDAIRVANLDFNKQNADWSTVRPEFLDILADVGLEFRLARKDPQGNCTKGITRTVSPLSHVGDQAMKELIQWPPTKYLNVWVCAYANGAAGYAVYPATAANSPQRDGIVLRHDYVGSIGTGSVSRSRTFTHEIGHWANLRHVWGNSNDPGLPENCDMDDNVADTPNSIGWTTCLLSGASCGEPLNNVENYMEYSGCRRMFTNGQAARMIAALNSSVAGRNQLWSDANLLATGVSTEPELCAANFLSSTRTICAGGTIAFTDASYHGVTSRTWSFPGGMPATSDAESVTVTYATPGMYPVSLTVSDGSNELTVDQPGYVVVLPDQGEAAPITEGFESILALEAPDWTLSNPDGDNTFAITNAAAHTGSHSIRIVNSAAMDGLKDDLYSRTYDLSDAEDVTVTFRYAYAQRSTANDDRLRFYVSNNCGTSWSLRKQLRGSTDLNTAGGVVTGNFVPEADDWRQAVVSNIGTTFHVSDFRFRFEFESDGGNSVYIDDININGQPVGIDEIEADGGLMVVPNPTAGGAQLHFRAAVTGPATFEVLDMAGRVLAEGNAGGGNAPIDLPVTDLPDGIYVVRLRTELGLITARFTVAR
jgi:plastocyanin